MLVGEQGLQRRDDEHQPVARELGLLDQKPLTIGFVAEGPHQRVCRQAAAASRAIVEAAATTRALIDEAPRRHQLVAAQLVLLVGFAQRALGPLIVGAGDLRRDRDRDPTVLHSVDQALLAVIEQAQEAADVFRIEIGLARDLGLIVAALAEVADLLNQLDLAVLAPGNVLDQAHDHAVLFAGLDHERRDLALAQRLVSFEATLTADQIVMLLAIVPAATGDRDRPLQAEMGDVGDDVAEHPRATLAGIGNVDPLDRDHADLPRGPHHAATGSLTRSAMPKKKSRLAKRKQSRPRPLSSARRRRAGCRSSCGSR
jgi:hypothetical protein